MNTRRYWELEAGWDAKLTLEERADGWHFCPDWDFMLIGPTMPEWETCTCAWTGKPAGAGETK